MRSDEQLHRTDLPAWLAGEAPRDVFFHAFYHGVDPTGAEFAGGQITGHVDMGIPGRSPGLEREISGSYRRDRFEVRIALPTIAGLQGYQVVSGRLVDPAS